jgi:hypothetical protein
LRTLARESQNSVHAEHIVWDELERMGVKPRDVKRIYSELEPCGNYPGFPNCAKWLEETFPRAKVTWSFPYNTPIKAARKEAVRDLRKTVGKFFELPEGYWETLFELLDLRF